MKAISNIRAVMAILIFFFSLSFVSCTEETLDYNILTWIYSSSN